MNLSSMLDSSAGKFPDRPEPRRLIVADPLPHTPTGKVMKHVPRDIFPDQPALQQQDS